MITKEIIEIINEYGTEEQINNIKEDINSFIKNIKNIQNEIANQIHQIHLSENEDDDITIMYDDIHRIKGYLSKLKESNSKINYSNQSIDVSVQPESSFDRVVNVYILDDDLCSICNVKLQPYTIHYQSISNNEIEDKKIKWYRCPNCKKLFVLDCDADDFDFEKTNIEIDNKYYSVVPQINIYSVIVLSNTLKCSSKCKTKDIIAKIPVFIENGELSYVSVNASYCFDCNRFTILKDDFNNIKDVAACKVSDETSYYDNSSREEIDIVQRNSILFNYGYNVKSKSNLTQIQRRRILSSVIEANIMTRRNVIDHINTLIHRGEKIPSWKSATEKWISDKEFISNYEIGDLPEVIFNEIILKYRKQNIE